MAIRNLSLLNALLDAFEVGLEAALEASGWRQENPDYTASDRPVPPRARNHHERQHWPVNLAIINYYQKIIARVVPRLCNAKVVYSAKYLGVHLGPAAGVGVVSCGPQRPKWPRMPCGCVVQPGAMPRSAHDSIVCRSSAVGRECAAKCPGRGSQGVGCAPD